MHGIAIFDNPVYGKCRMRHEIALHIWRWIRWEGNQWNVLGQELWKVMNKTMNALSWCNIHKPNFYFSSCFHQLYLIDVSECWNKTSDWLPMKCKYKTAFYSQLIQSRNFCSSCQQHLLFIIPIVCAVDVQWNQS
jgi:hypothetical protein